MFGLMWLMLIRPQRQQQRRQAEMLAALKEGDEIVTAGGIYGEIKSLDAERVRLEVDADVEIMVARRAIASVVPPEAEEPHDDAVGARAAGLDDAESEVRETAEETAEEPVEEDRAAR